MLGEGAEGSSGEPPEEPAPHPSEQASSREVALALSQSAVVEGKGLAHWDQDVDTHSRLARWHLAVFSTSFRS